MRMDCCLIWKKIKVMKLNGKNIFVALPLALGAPVTFALLSRACFMFRLLAPPPCTTEPSPWLALWYEMVSHWLSSHFLEYSPINSFSNLKQHYSAALGLGALVSSLT